MISSETLLTVLLPSLFILRYTQQHDVTPISFNQRFLWCTRHRFSPTRSRRYERDRPTGRRDGPGRVLGEYTMKDFLSKNHETSNSGLVASFFLRLTAWKNLSFYRFRKFRDLMMRSIHLQGYKVNQDVERDLRHLCFEPLKVAYC